jgi:hypothetical protein
MTAPRTRKPLLVTISHQLQPEDDPDSCERWASLSRAEKKEGPPSNKNESNGPPRRHDRDHDHADDQNRCRDRGDG